MFTKFSKILSLLVVIALLATVGAGAVLAQDRPSTPGAGPATALMPADGVVSIGPGQWQWYVFRSQVPVNVEADDDDVVTDPEDATISAALRLQSGAVDFEVWSPNDFNNWVNDDDFDALGIGTENEFMPGDPLFWKGSFKANNNYYLIVKNRSAQTSYYALSITGNVAFPSTLALSTDTEGAMAQMQEPMVSAEEMALTVDMPAEVAAEEPAMMTSRIGFDAASAMMPANGVVRIEPGQWQWYTFNSRTPFDVEADEEDVVTDPTDATIDAALRVQSGAVDFEVWSLNNLNAWYDNVEFDATGKGTTNEFLPGDPLFWQGTVEGRQSFYLIVMNRGTEPATYSLDITGDVHFPSTASLPIE